MTPSERRDMPWIMLGFAALVIIIMRIIR